MRKAFWTRLGLTERDIRERPWKQNEADLTIIAAEVREEAMAQAKANRRW